jgi:hypothetical protein
MSVKQQNKILSEKEKHLIQAQYKILPANYKKPSNKVTELAEVIKDWEHRKELESATQELQLKQILEHAKQQKNNLHKAKNKTIELQHTIAQLKNEVK